MQWSEHAILKVLDDCCDSFSFPMLDNGYVYLAATRLSVFRSRQDWALTIEVFGFSPRAGVPDNCIQTFASTLQNRKTRADYVNQQAYDAYLENNPYNESRFIHPIQDGEWIDGEQVAENITSISVRGESIRLPNPEEYKRHGIRSDTNKSVNIFELCRWLAATNRQAVLGTPNELRINVPADLEMIMQLDEWHHPDIVDDDCRPSGSETFQQLTRVILSGDISHYQPTKAPNTHWQNWPDGGTL